MNSIFSWLVLFLDIFFFLSCKTHPDSDRTYAGDGKVYKLRINPAPGSKYQYQISNESTLNMEVDSKPIESIKKADVTINYGIEKDSLGDFVLTIGYEKIHVYTKNNNQESELSTENSTNSLDPMEKLLGALKGADIIATVGRAGDVKTVRGYTEIASKILSEAASVSLPDKQKMQLQWKTVVEKGMIKKNMDLLFRMFPDSSVRIGDRWKLTSKDDGDLSFSVNNAYTLISIKDGIADIESRGVISSDTASALLMGYDVVANLSGQQQGSYSMDIRTGMLVNCKVTAEIEGKIQMMGRDIPVKMSTGVKMDGKKVH
ncbi:MAG TPA: DUF6263 family protein [Puia sp.]|nr:DUF6263 family protein [Puia sp.]